MNLAFAGTPEFARIALQALLDAGHSVSLVLTQPDRPAGRGLRLTPSPVKLLASERGLPVIQPRGLRLDGRWADDAAAARDSLEATAPDALIVAAYGLILPRWVLALPAQGCLNIHASLLPRWRGAAPIQRAIEAGDRDTGVCIMRMDEGLDTGPVLLRAAEPIRDDDTAGTLHDRLASLGARTLLQALDALAAGGLTASPQPADGATYARKIDKSECWIDWSLPAQAIERRIRAFTPAPGCQTRWGELVLKVGRCIPDSAAALSEDACGQVLSVSPDGVVVACGAGTLRLLELQRPGGRMLPVADFVRGTAIAPGQLFQ